LGRYATYVGASPYQAPAVLNTIAHTELTEGVTYARGGIYTIAEAYARLARELGVEIRTKRRVTDILVDADRAVAGVRLADGAEIPARTIIANVDVTTVYHDLLPDAIAQRRFRWLTARQPSLSGFVLLLGIEGHTEELIQHNVLFPHDYRREFTDIFNRGVPPESPTNYVTITSKQDPEHAPTGCENWFVLVNVPPLTPGVDWADAEGPLRERILERLAETGFDIRDRIVEAHTITPQDLAQRTGAWRGSLYGISSN
jgi:phytoene desaturase